MANLTQYQLNRRRSNRVVYTKITVQHTIHSRNFSFIQKPQTCNQKFILATKLRLGHPSNGYRKPDSLLLYWSLIINGCYIQQINRPSLFCDVTWRRIVVGYRRFVITCQSHSQESSIPRIMVEFPRNTLGREKASNTRRRNFTLIPTIRNISQ